MSDFLNNLLWAVLAVVIPVVSGGIVSALKKLAENAAAKTESIKTKTYVDEIAAAVSDAVSMTSQTYVDALKSAGTFTKEAQATAASKALAVCIASLSASAAEFITETYGDLTEYLTTKIEAEVRSQKATTGTVLATLESTTE